MKVILVVFTAPLNALSRYQLKWNTDKNTPTTPWHCSAPVSVNGAHLLTIYS